MPFTVPTAAQFKARYAEFVDQEDALVNALLQAAASEAVDEDIWAERDYQPGVMAFAAHLLQLFISASASQASAGGGAGAGEVTTYASKVKFEGYELSFSEAGSSRSSVSVSSGGGAVSDVFLAKTDYGKYFAGLLQRNVIPLVAL